MNGLRHPFDGCIQQAGRDTLDDALDSKLAIYVEIGGGAEGQHIGNLLMRVAKGVPKSHIYHILRFGEVRVNRGRTGAGYHLELGDLVRIPPLWTAQQVEAACLVPTAGFTIPREDTHLLVIDKPTRATMRGSSGVAFRVIEQLRQSCPDTKFLELVRRLGREMPGTPLPVKKRSVLVALRGQTREGQLDKRYLATVKSV